MNFNIKSGNWDVGGNDEHGKYEYFLANSIILMQWTGLQINGQDLYEGDIVDRTFTTVNGEIHEIGVIKFGEHETSDDYYASTAYGFHIEWVNSPFGSTVDSLPCRDMIIIGNIYETRELLNAPV